MMTTHRKSRTTTDPPPPRTGVQPKPLIMVVGPHEETRYMLRVMLELWNYEVIEAKTSEESLLLGRACHPSLLLMDTTADFADCLDNINRIRHDDGMTAVPSIMMSGYSQDIYRDAALNSGASHFIPKPVDFDLLQTYIETLLRNNSFNTRTETLT